MKKNIIVITMLPLWSMQKGSGGKALYCTVSSYANAGFNVLFVTNQQNDYSKIENIKSENVYYINQEWYTQKNTKHSKLAALKYFLQFERRSYQVLKKILTKFSKDDKVLLYAYEVNAVKSAKKISKKYHIPLVTRFQGTIMANKPANLYYKIRKYPHIQALSAKADLVIMTDDGTQGDKVLDSYHNRSNRLFIRNGVNILDEQITPIDKKALKQEWNIPTESTVLLTVSRLEGWKKVDRAIRALHALKEKEKYYLIIVGEGAKRESLEALVKELQLENYTKFTGAVKNEEVKQYMQLADIFLSFYNLSNVGNPLLEALCLGKPIITYDVGDTNQIINGKNGILLQDVSPENIARNLENMNHQEILENYSKNAFAYAKENLYSWKKRMEIEIKEVNQLFS